jgi:hypothetical protein
VKGGDYTRDRVVGAEIVEARGGRVVLVDLVTGQSTSNLVAALGSSASAAERDRPTNHPEYTHRQLGSVATNAADARVS